MSTILNNKLSKLKDMSLSLGLPKDDYKNHVFLSPLQLYSHSKLHYKFSLLVDKFVQETKGNRGAKQLEVFRHHWQWVLLGLNRAAMMNSWLLIALGKTTYSSDIWLKRYEIKYRSIKEIFDYLKEQNLITILEGKKFKNKPSRTRIFPKDKLFNLLWEFCLDQEQPIEGPYLTINDTDSEWEETMFKVRADESHSDMGDMIAINELSSLTMGM